MQEAPDIKEITEEIERCDEKHEVDDEDYVRKTTVKGRPMVYGEIPGLVEFSLVEQPAINL